jgi:hypothetical protein
MPNYTKQYGDCIKCIYTFLLDCDNVLIEGKYKKFSIMFINITYKFSMVLLFLVNPLYDNNIPDLWVQCKSSELLHKTDS